MKVDIDEGDNDEAPLIDYSGGCYTDGDIGYYEMMDYNTTYYLNGEHGGVTIEVRHKDDPYTVFAEAHYNMGRDLELFEWLSVFTLAMAAALILILGVVMLVLTIQTRKHHSEHRRLRGRSCAGTSRS